MSLIDRLPTRRPRPARKHRASDHIAALKAEHAADLAELGDEIVQLRKSNVKLVRSLASADEFFRQQDANMTALERELAAEQRARAIAEADIATRDRWIADLKRDLGDTRERMKVNALAETAVTETQEIPVITLHEAAAAGRLGPVTDPGRIS